MKRLHIFNPAAGGGHSPELLTKGAANGEESYITTGVGDAERFVYEICNQREEAHFVVYGGDGTANEVANGIIKADAGKRCLMSVVPAGTGNDFVRTFHEKGKIYEIDAIKYRSFSDDAFSDLTSERYSINIINFGFDSRVVTKTDTYKKVFSGSAAYIAGVVDCFLRGLSESWRVQIEDTAGNKEALNDEYTLALAANCRYYGGGFHSASLANPTDGLVDFIAFKKVSRARLVYLIGDYKKGLHLDKDKERPVDKFQKYMIYRRCKALRISGISDICIDGEIEAARSAEISVAPKVIRIAT